MGYEVYHMNDLDSSGQNPSEIDSFICFNTREERALKALLELNKRNSLNNAMVMSFNSVNSTVNIEDLQVTDISISSFKIDENLSSNFIPCLQEINKYIAGKINIGIDISCMPIPFFTQILHFIHKKHNDKQLTIYYTEPMHYTLNNLFDFSAYSGEIDIKTIPGFEGETSQIDEVKRVVFYLMGFEMTYLNKLIPQDVNPNAIAPINGFPSYFPKYKDISLINNNTNFYEKDVEIIFCEANNPFDTYNTMVRLQEKYKHFRIDIIPVGTKPMALGACLFALKNGNTNCRIIFPFPSEYKLNQSAGCGKLWEYKIKTTLNSQINGR